MYKTTLTCDSCDTAVTSRYIPDTWLIIKVEMDNTKQKIHKNFIYYYCPNCSEDINKDSSVVLRVGELSTDDMDD